MIESESEKSISDSENSDSSSTVDHNLSPTKNRNDDEGSNYNISITKQSQRDVGKNKLRYRSSKITAFEGLTVKPEARSTTKNVISKQDMMILDLVKNEVKKLQQQMKMNEGVELSHLSSMNSEMPKSELKIGILRLILPSIIDLKKLESLGLNIQEPPSPIGISMKHQK